MTLYFAYGATTDTTDRDAWMRDHGFEPTRFDLVGPALLLDRVLSFERYSRVRGGGVATLTVAPGQAVDGVLFEVDEHTLAALDAKEGHPHSFLRESVHAILPNGRALQAWTHDLPPGHREAPTPPTSAYHRILVRGFTAHGLGRTALDHAVAATMSEAAPPPLLVPWLFVYGTLRAKQPNAHLLDPLPRLPATCRGVLHDHGAYPAMALGAGTVEGELVPLDPARLPALDALEDARPFGAPGGTYRRTVLTATLPDGTTHAAQTYVQEDQEGFPLIPSGDWLSVGDRRAAWAAHARG